MTTTITHSLIKQFKNCPQACHYKYVENLAPKRIYSKPLHRGTWFHALLEAKYKGENVTKVHQNFVAQYGKLMDEEQEFLGNLPAEMAALYKAYRWHYRDDRSWTVHEVEIKLEADLPNGLQAQGKIDMLVEDEYGLWLVDHKTHKTLPRTDYRLLDFQSDFYIWMAHECGIPVQGFIWNYVVPKSPQPLKFSKRNGDLNKRQSWTDYPTAYRSAEEHDMLEDAAVQDKLAQLRAVRYDRDRPQSSDVFRRDLVERNPLATKQIVADMNQSGKRYVTWRKAVESGKVVIERNVSRACDWCEFRNLCVAELIGTDAAGVRRREYEERDPFGYYEEKELKS